MNNKLKAVVYLLLANTIWASAGLIIRWISMSGTMILFMSGIGAMAALLVYATVTKKISLLKEIKFSKINMLYMSLSATMGVLIFNAFSDDSFPIAATNLILNSVPFLAVLTAPLLIGEKSVLREYVYATIGFIGLVIFIFGQQNGISFGGVSIGLFLALGALIVNNFGSMVNRIISQKSNELTVPFFVALGNILVAPIFVLLLNQFDAQSITVTNVSLGLLLGVTSTFLGFLFITLAYQNLKVQVASTISLIQPVLTAIIGYIFLAEKFGLLMIIGGLVVILATAGIIFSKEK